MSELTTFVDNEKAMERLGAQLAECLAAPSVVFLRGDLGAGKTTLVRGVLRGWGWAATVKSPTYTLVETYAIGGFDCHHFDLYRLADPEELEFLGLRDYLSKHSILFVEWPDKGIGTIPAPDLEIFIDYREEVRSVRLVGQVVDVFKKNHSCST